MWFTKPRVKRLFLVVGTVLFGSVCWFCGYWFGGVRQNLFFKVNQFDNAKQNANATTVIKPEQYDLFWQVWQHVQSDYVNQPVSDQTLMYGAISGVAAAVQDPYTVFMDPEQAALFTPTIDGQFEGIGAEIGVKDGQIVIIAPLKGSPAEQAGLQAGDAIIKIDGVDTINMTVDKAVSVIRGTKDTTVTLTIYRTSATDVQDIIIKRAEIKIPSTVYTIKEQAGKRIGIIELSHFNKGSKAEFNKIAQQVLLDAPDGLILDLRNNPGGLLDQCVDIASLFISDGVIVKEKFSDGREEVFSSQGDAVLANQTNMVVLINEGSASAAEILAGALQDYKKATIIGTTSFGKGSVQNFQQFPDNSVLKVTAAKWLTPLNKTIDHTGIQPDIEVKLTSADITTKTDAQLNRAMNELINK
ncbi:MAG: S41 family peptidase [Patescibacteria group bacterium]